VLHVVAARRRVLVCVLGVAGVLAAGCSEGSRAAVDPQTPSPTRSPSSASVSPSAAPSPTARQAASRAAYAAYVGFQADIAAVVNSSRSDTDPRLARHAASTGIALAAQSIEHYVANHFGIRGGNRVDHWRVVSFYPRTGKPTAMTAISCVDSSSSRVYDIRSGKEETPLAGHQRTPVTVREQLDHGAWKVVDAKSDFTKTC